jgi:hypothetical protein
MNGSIEKSQVEFRNKNLHHELSAMPNSVGKDKFAPFDPLQQTNARKKTVT